MVLSHRVLEAACRGEVEKVKEYFAQNPGFDPDETAVVGENQRRTLLEASVNCLHVDVVRLLLEKGATVGVRDELRWTPLIRAAAYRLFLPGDAEADYPRRAIEICRLLLDRGADIHAQTDIGFTPLFQCAMLGDLRMVRFFLSRGASFDAPRLTGTLEEFVRSARHNEEYGRGNRNRLLALIADVRAAGGWKAYTAAPRSELCVLRVLCERGRAQPAPGLEGAFGWAPPSGGARDRQRRTRASKQAARAKRSALPRELFLYVLGFWRSERDFVWPG